VSTQPQFNNNNNNNNNNTNNNNNNNNNNKHIKQTRTAANQNEMYYIHNKKHLKICQYSVLV
jgi:hypothetical protein